MARPKTKPAFTDDQKSRVHALLAIRVAHMMGRKLEEGDWAEVYCLAKEIPLKGWSNLDIDIAHGSLGVEHKMVRYSSKGDISEACGTSLMHPSATRSIRVPLKSTPENEAMRDILTQYGDLINARRAKVREQSGTTSDPDMRTGWLLWQDSLRQFLYFEEEMLVPNPDEYEAKWVSRPSKSGGRKESTNLWIYEKTTGAKRYSVTTEAGAKIQPYFDVPPLTDPNLYIFTVIGEVVAEDPVRVWLTEATARELNRLLGNLDTDTVSKAILETANAITRASAVKEAEKEIARPILITTAAYNALQSVLLGVSDEFFIAIRECYNRRTTEVLFERLSFCLIGVATPTDLIQDTRLSPFNIGRRIVLEDFTSREAALLGQGLAGRKAVLDRILYWTGGHPYLTQRLCRVMAEEPQSGVSGDVDRLCTELFLTHRARETDDNLAFVRNRLLRSEVDQAALLELYGRICVGKRVADDETNPLCGVVKLSGVVRVENGLLRVRNRIYERAFDRLWVVTHLPDAEVRRQRRAFRRGCALAGAAAGVVLTLIGGLAGLAIRNAHQAATSARQAAENEKLAVANAEQAKRDAASARAAQSLADGNAALARQEKQRADAKAQLADAAWRAAEAAHSHEADAHLE